MIGLNDNQRKSLELLDKQQNAANGVFDNKDTQVRKLQSQPIKASKDSNCKEVNTLINQEIKSTNEYDLFNVDDLHKFIVAKAQKVDFCELIDSLGSNHKQYERSGILNIPQAIIAVLVNNTNSVN